MSSLTRASSFPALPHKASRCGLLVSVRNAEEALTAFEGGADVIDIKEPHRGPLGAADHETMSEIVYVIKGRRPVTAAVGELHELTKESFTRFAHVQGLAALKVGLSTQRDEAWRDCIEGYRSMLTEQVCLIPVAYADYQAAKAPNPQEIIQTAGKDAWRWVVIDTWNKGEKTLFNHFTTDELDKLLRVADKKSIRVALAGGLAEDEIHLAAKLHPRLIGIRGAVCVGGRDGLLCPHRVNAIADNLHIES